MADITIEDTNLEDVRRRASELASVVGSLATLFDEEATRLKREDEVARLKVLRSAVLERVEQAKGEEMAASIGHNEGGIITSLFRLGAGLITMTFENKTMQAISRELLAGSRGREPPYGMVLVRIGPGGVPEDVDVVSISRLARESNRDEREVMDGLLSRHHLLMSDEAFSLLIDRLATEILKGGLRLPVSVEEVSKLTESTCLRLVPSERD